MFTECVKVKDACHLIESDFWLFSRTFRVSVSYAFHASLIRYVSPSNTHFLWIYFHREGKPHGSEEKLNWIMAGDWLLWHLSNQSEWRESKEIFFSTCTSGFLNFQRKVGQSLATIPFTQAFNLVLNLKCYWIHLHDLIALQSQLQQET
jgi:hypothetical protein